ncbi:hypothetical protein BpHYR1_029510 [Brachionus plicatilis]|uniref:Uncharacterized protein n=1 Tax=Brachionus plicatilis TaxID=10195 RepID=A0A3M7RPA3_BRAPC|nr:hypothetical protein BpHYR1_029510 [Brachionus plicatilis]
MITSSWLTYIHLIVNHQIDSSYIIITFKFILLICHSKDQFYLKKKEMNIKFFGNLMEFEPISELSEQSDPSHTLKAIEIQFLALNLKKQNLFLQ